MKTKIVSLVIAIVIFLGAGAIAWHFLFPSSENKAETHPTFVENLTAAETVLDDYLVSPSTAKFSFEESDWKIVTNDNKRVKLESFVDSENRLGGTVRTEFTIIITYADDYESFKINEVILDGKKVV